MHTRPVVLLQTHLYKIYERARAGDKAKIETPEDDG
jgi:hypothetical protein